MKMSIGVFFGGGGVELDSCLLFIKNSFKRSIPMTKRQYLVGTCIDYSEFFGKLATEKSKLCMLIFSV